MTPGLFLFMTFMTSRGRFLWFKKKKANKKGYEKMNVLLTSLFSLPPKVKFI